MTEVERVLPIRNECGLHARASTRFAQVAQQFESRVMVSREWKNGDGHVLRSDEVDGKSILALLSLGAECGDRLRVRVLGADAEKALAEVTELVEDRFGEQREA